MDTREIEEILARTLDDGGLSRSEERALRWVVRDLQPDGHQRNVIRSRVFEIAEETIKDRHGHTILTWVRKALLAVERGANAGDPCRADAVFSPGPECLNRIRGLFASARARVDVCVFTITDDRIASAILDAHERGVRIRIITDDDKRNDPGSDIDRLQSAGVSVRTDRTPDHMHHKFAIFDGRQLLNGSFNWTRSASTANEENLLLIDDRRLLTPYQEEFDRLWKEYGE